MSDVKIPLPLSISEESIAEGVRRDCWKCPTAIEFQKLFPGCPVMAGRNRTFVTVKPGLDAVFRHPAELSHWIEAYDEGLGVLPMDPIEVEITQMYWADEEGKNVSDSVPI